MSIILSPQLVCNPFIIERSKAEAKHNSSISVYNRAYNNFLLLDVQFTKSVTFTRLQFVYITY